jgi:hypothetical protein
VSEALTREAERGLLEPYLQWRCTECDSPSREAIDRNEALGYCVSCEAARNYEAILYFKGTDALMRDLDDPPDDDLKKVQAATEESIKRIASASQSPQEMDVVSANNPLLERLIKGVERTAEAAEAGIPHLKRTADSTHKTAHDWMPNALQIAGIVILGTLAVLATLVTVIVASRPHFFDKYAPGRAPSHTISVQANRPHPPRRRR